jgi:hypothetical protein
MASDCACVYVGDYDGPEFCHAERRRARKTHKCDECWREIVAGETYEHVRGKWDGYMSTFKTCGDCLSIRDSFFCEGFMYGGLWEDLHEHLHAVVRFGTGIDSSCLVSLTPRAREKVCDEIEELWEGMDDDRSGKTHIPRAT